MQYDSIIIDDISGYTVHKREHLVTLKLPQITPDSFPENIKFIRTYQTLLNNEFYTYAVFKLLFSEINIQTYEADDSWLIEYGLTVNINLHIRYTNFYYSILILFSSEFK